MGTKLRHIKGNNLETLELELYALPYNIEHKATIYKPNGEWVIQFTLPDDLTYAMQNDQAIMRAVGSLKGPAKKLK